MLFDWYRVNSRFTVHLGVGPDRRPDHWARMRSLHRGAFGLFLCRGPRAAPKLPDGGRVGGAEFLRGEWLQRRCDVELPAVSPYDPHFPRGAIAQPGERNTGSVEVGGSIPPGSTN